MNSFKSNMLLCFTIFSIALPFASAAMEQAQDKYNFEQQQIKFCPICQEHIEEYHEYICGHNCQHRFHTACIAPWIATGKITCPVCNKELHKKENSTQPAQKKQALWFNKASEGGVLNLDTHNLLLNTLVTSSSEFAFWMLKYQRATKKIQSHNSYTDHRSSSQYICDGNQLIYSTNERCIKVVNLLTHEIQASFVHNDATFSDHISFAYNKAAGCLASGDRYGVIKIWDIAQKRCKNVLEDIEDRKNFDIQTLNLDEIQNNIIYSASYNGLIKIWDIESGLVLDTINIESLKCETDIVCTKFYNKKCFIGLKNGNIIYVDLVTKVCSVLKPANTNDNPFIRCLESIRCLDYNRYTHTLISVNTKGIMRIWDLVTMECLSANLLKDGYQIIYIAFDNTHQRMFVLLDDGCIKIYDSTNGTCQEVFLYDEDLPSFHTKPESISFDEENNRLIISSFRGFGGKILFWDLGSLEEQRKILNSIYKDLLFKTAYQCFVKKQQQEIKELTLVLYEDLDLYEAFFDLPAAMQQVIRDHVIVLTEPLALASSAEVSAVEPVSALVPAPALVTGQQAAVPVPAPIASTPAAAKQEMWKEWFFGKPY